jgi:hypothetical protein
MAVGPTRPTLDDDETHAALRAMIGELEQQWADALALARSRADSLEALAQIVAERTTERDALRTALTRSDGLLSLLRYRCEQAIPWGALGIPALRQVDEMIGTTRAVLAQCGGPRA